MLKIEDKIGKLAPSTNKLRGPLFITEGLPEEENRSQEQIEDHLTSLSQEKKKNNLLEPIYGWWHWNGETWDEL